jgi:hypothetical protein
MLVSEIDLLTNACKEALENLSDEVLSKVLLHIDTEGRTYLMHASYYGSAELLQRLLILLGTKNKFIDHRDRVSNDD